MSRWPDPMTQAFLREQSDRRFAAIEAVMERRRREYRRAAPLPDPIVDRDPGDEDDGK